MGGAEEPQDHWPDVTGGARAGLQRPHNQGHRVLETFSPIPFRPDERLRLREGLSPWPPKPEAILFPTPVPSENAQSCRQRQPCAWAELGENGPRPGVAPPLRGGVWPQKMKGEVCLCQGAGSASQGGSTASRARLQGSASPTQPLGLKAVEEIQSQARDRQPGVGGPYLGTS